MISQTREIHDAVGELIAQLRQLHEVQILVEARFVRIPDTLFERVGIHFDSATDPQDAAGLAAADEKSAMLSDLEVALFLRAANSSPKANLIAAPKITLFNGQSGSISMSSVDEGRDGTFKFQAVCSDDHRSVRLRFAVGAETNISDARVRTVSESKTLLLNVTDDVTSEMLGAARPNRGLPLLGDIPYISRVFQNTGDSAKASHDCSAHSAHHRPRRRSSRNRCSVGSTPRIIVQEEEEALLGIDVETSAASKP